MSNVDNNPDKDSDKEPYIDYATASTGQAPDPAAGDTPGPIPMFNSVHARDVVVNRRKHGANVVRVTPGHISKEAPALSDIHFHFDDGGPPEAVVFSEAFNRARVILKAMYEGGATGSYGVEAFDKDIELCMSTLAACDKVLASFEADDNINMLRSVIKSLNRMAVRLSKVWRDRKD